MNKVLNTRQLKEGREAGWTTLEYVIGALIILAAVIVAAKAISGLITGKAGSILNLPGMP